jgi:hypothetical protein
MTFWASAISFLDIEDFVLLDGSDIAYMLNPA